MAKDEQSIPSPFSKSAYDLYYDAMEMLQSEDMGDAIQALQVLEQAYKLEPNLIDLQLGYIEAYNTLGIHASVRAHIELGFLMVTERFPKWPKRLEWGDIDNRGYLRIIQAKADWSWDQGDTEMAEDLYRLLLRLNPHDNQGVRYVLAALYAGLSGEELDTLWLQSNESQDFSRVETMLEKQNQKHHFWDPPDLDDEE